MKTRGPESVRRREQTAFPQCARVQQPRRRRWCDGPWRWPRRDRRACETRRETAVFRVDVRRAERSAASRGLPVAASLQTRLEAVRGEAGAGGAAGQCAQVCPRTHSRRARPRACPASGARSSRPSGVPGAGDRSPRPSESRGIGRPRDLRLLARRRLGRGPEGAARRREWRGCGRGAAWHEASEDPGDADDEAHCGTCSVALPTDEPCDVDVFGAIVCAGCTRYLDDVTVRRICYRGFATATTARGVLDGPILRRLRGRSRGWVRGGRPRRRPHDVCPCPRTTAPGPTLTPTSASRSKRRWRPHERRALISSPSSARLTWLISIW